MKIPFLKNLGPRDCIGFDMGKGEWKWAKISRPTPERYKLSFLDSTPAPKDPDQFLGALREYVTKKNLGGTPTAVSFHDESLHMKKLELPRMPPEDLKEAVRWQMRDIVEGSTDDYTVHYAPLKETTSGDVTRLALLGYAAKKTVLKNLEMLLTRASLKPFFIEPTPVSLAYTVERLFPTIENEWVGTVDIGLKWAYFMAIGQGKLQYVKTMQQVSLEEAETLSDNYPARLAVEIQHAIDAFSIAYQVEKVEKLFLTGGGATLPNLSERLSQNIGILTQVLNPFQGIEQANNFPLAGQKPFLFGPALGLAFLQP